VFSLNLFHDLLSRSYLQHCVYSELTGRSSLQTARLHAPVRSLRQIGLAVAASVAAVERAQLIPRVNTARHENCDTHTLSMGVRDCIRYKMH